MNKWMYIAGTLLIAGFALLGMLEMIKSRTPYVTTVAEVQSAAGRPVQFIGTIVREKTSYDDQTDELLFHLRDNKGGTLAVRYKGVKPANFDSADKAAVRGTYRGNELIAEQVLIGNRGQ